MSEAEAEFHELRELVKAGATSAHPSVFQNTVSSVWHRVWTPRLLSGKLSAAVPAGATECRRRSRDIRKEDRQWDVGVVKRQQLNSVPKGTKLMVSRTIHPHGATTPWDRQLRKP